jgi:hypothetical protein
VKIFNVNFFVRLKLTNIIGSAIGPLGKLSDLQVVFNLVRCSENELNQVKTTDLGNGMTSYQPPNNNFGMKTIELEDNIWKTLISEIEDWKQFNISDLEWVNNLKEGKKDLFPVVEIPKPKEISNVQLASVARELNDAELAISLSDKAILESDSIIPYQIKASCLGDLCRHEEALKTVDAGLLKAKNDVEGRQLLHERGFQNLLLGNYDEGWKYWEYRTQRKELGENLAKVWPGILEWDGSPNQRVLVCGEKGLGDSILFGRYLEVLQERNCTVQFLASKASAPMAGMLKGYPGVYGTYCNEDAIPPLSQYWITLESLPKYTTEIPEPFKFLIPLNWKASSRDGRNLRVGFCWHGNLEYSASKQRRPEDLKFWEPVLQVPGVDFISLQLGEQGPCKTLLPATNSLLDTVKEICSCDLVISTDTAVVHMAATTGIPTWMPLHYLNYWPWIKKGETETVWYPSLKIYRQKENNNWDHPFQNIAEDLIKERLKGSE